MTYDACLRLNLPFELEEQLIDHLLQHPEWVGPFAAHGVDGHGTPGSIASGADEVRGCARRVAFEILMRTEHVPALIAHLRADLPGADVSWWLGPVLDSGDFS